jgi:hypothetical protein
MKTEGSKLFYLPYEAPSARLTCFAGTCGYPAIAAVDIECPAHPDAPMKRVDVCREHLSWVFGPQGEEEEEAADFVIHIGKAFYTPTSFKKEAAELGVSRRIRLPLPKGLVTGKSRIYCAFGATGAKAETYKPGKIHGYFIPEQIEYIAGPDGKVADLFAPVLMTKESRIIGSVDGEKRRGCGFRKPHGVYVVATLTESPYVKLEKPFRFDGAHSRGITRLEHFFSRDMKAAAAEGKHFRLDLRTPTQMRRWKANAEKAAIKRELEEAIARLRDTLKQQIIEARKLEAAK